MVSIVLSHPQMGENIGAAARAMQNFGLSDLRLVKPRDGWPNERAIIMSSGAFDHMPAPKIFDSLSDAIADLHYVFATTARPRDMVKDMYTPQEAIELAYTRQSSGQNIGIVFGAERTGMRNDEITQCQAIITVPTNPAFSSLNLGQSVLLIAYEWIKQSGIKKPASNMQTPATQDEIRTFMDRLFIDLDDRRFFRSPDLTPTMQRNIENIFTRAELTEQEVRTLHGILSALRGNKTQK